MKKIICVILCLMILTATFTSCGTPDIEQVRGRLEYLLEKSYTANVLLFGEGPETYERVYDPKASMKYFEAESGQRYYYFYIEDEKLGKILGYRTKAYGDDYKYLLVSDTPQEEKTVYTDSENGLYYISIDYKYEDKEFYYDESIPSDYDVIKLDGEFTSIDSIKECAETVYSGDYLSSIYETLFTGIMISDDIETGLLSARYIEYEETSGEVWFMKSNAYEPLMKEKRIFDVSSAEIARGSSSKRLRIDIDSHLESTPEKNERITLNLVLEDGEWFLDSGTY